MQVCRKIRDEYLLLHRRRTTWHVAVGDISVQTFELPRTLFINRAFDFDPVPEKVAKSWEGNIHVHLPHDKEACKNFRGLFTRLLVFLSIAPVITITFRLPQPIMERRRWNPAILLTAMFSRSSPSFPQYVARNRDSILNVSLCWWKTSHLLECSILFRKSQLPEWLSTIIQEQKWDPYSPTFRTWYGLDQEITDMGLKPPCGSYTYGIGMGYGDAVALKIRYTAWHNP